MNENKTPAPEGVYNCAYMGAKRSGKSTNAQHFVLSIRLKPLDCGVEENEVCEYFAELPLCYKIGVEYGFYDKATNTNKKRKTTAKDTEVAVEYARKCFPAWAEFMDTLPDTASFAEAFAWFDEPHPDVTVRAKIKPPREYDGKTYYEASIYEISGKSAVGDAGDFNTEFGNVFKAAKVKFGGKASAAPSAPKKAPPAAPKKPAAPAHKAKEATRDEAWAAFYALYAPKKGEAWCSENFVAECEKIIGGEECFATPELWGKCVETFNADS